MIRAGETENIFTTWREILGQQMAARIITHEDMAKQSAEFLAKREQPLTVEWPDSRGTVYYEPAENGRRRFELIDTRHIQARGNRLLQYIGAVVFACGFVGLFIEWRLRRLKNKLK